MNKGVFDGPQIRKLIKDVVFKNGMSDIELQAWKSYKDVTEKFLGNVNHSSGYDVPARHPLTPAHWQ